MAEAAQIEMVKDLLPDSWEEDGWSEEKIGLYLDAEQSVNKVMALFWEGKSSKLYQLIDVSESGSSRSLSKIYDNARTLAEHYRNRAKEEREEAKADVDDSRVTTFGRITRV